MLINSNLAIDPKGDWKRGFKVLKKFYCLPCKNFSHPKFETKTSHTFAKIIKNRINTLQWQNLNPHHVASSQDIDLPCHCEEVSENIFEQAWQYSSLEIIRLISCGLTCKWPYNPHTCIQNQLPFPCKTPLNISDVNWYKKPCRLKSTENCRLFCQYFTFTSPCALKKNSFEFFFFIYIFLFKDIPLHFHRRDLWYFLVCCFHKPWSKSMKLMLAVWPATKNVPPIICLPISYRLTKKLSKKICISKCFNQFNRLWKVYYKLHEIISTIPICI